ncbi:MAG: molybdopterin-dependent oxidoreductase [Thermoproteales archaeon]|nr:molybdopterin-dependent oxidoreductase [Thermoproteales archaeon]
MIITKYSVCPRDCYDTCFMKILLDENKIISIQADENFSFTGKFLCPRVVRDIDRIYLNRILFPYIRNGSKPGKNFSRVTWNHALTVITKKIKEVLKKYGPEKILHIEYAGNMGLLTWYFPLRLWNLLGATKTDYSICSKSGHEAISLHYGLSYGLLPSELNQMKLIVFWGFNAAVSSPHIWRQALKARKNGAVIATIDPRKSSTARNSDIWINPRPGSDVALTYGIAKYLIEHNYIDTNFIEEWTYGYREFEKETLRWNIKNIEDITGISRNKIKEIAEAYGRLKPSATLIGFGVQKSLNGAEAVRIISLLPALLGYHRGFYYSNSKGWYVDISYITGEKIIKKTCRTISQVALAKHLEKDDFKFIYIYNMNPLITLPDQARLRKALLKDDVFLVVHETHWTETTLFADVVLPATTFLEKKDLVIPYSHNFIRLSNRVIDPIGESKSEIWVMREIAKRLGIESDIIYENEMGALKKALINAIDNGEFEDLLKQKVLKLRMKPRNKYQTPTGKIEFYSITALKKGINPLPQQVFKKIKKGYYILLNSATIRYTHSQFREIYGPIPPIVEMNPIDAQREGIKNGDKIYLCNENDEVLVKVIIKDSVLPGVLWSPRQLVGLNNVPQNVLISSDTQKIGGGPIFNSTLVRIRKIS